MGVVVPPLPLYPQVTQRCINKTSSNAFSKCSVAWIKGPLLYKEMGKIKDLHTRAKPNILSRNYQEFDF